MSSSISPISARERILPRLRQIPDHHSALSGSSWTIKNLHNGNFEKTNILILVLILMVSPSASLVIAQSNLIPFDVENVADVQTLELLEFSVASEIVWHPNENIFIAANQEGIWRFDVESLSLEPILFSENAVDNLTISANGEIVAGRDNASIYLWDTDTNEQIVILEIDYADLLWLNDDGSILVFTLQSLNESIWKNTLHFWNVRMDVEVTSLEFDTPISAFAVNSDESLVATGHANGDVNLRNIDTGEIIYTFENYSGAIQQIEFNPDATTIALGGDSRELGIWHLYDGEYVSISRLSHLPDKLAFTSDGAILASSSILEEFIYLRDARDGSELAKLTGHESDVVALNFNSDNTLLATSSLDGTLRLWGIISS